MEVTPLIRRVVAHNPAPSPSRAPAPTSSATARWRSSIPAPTSRSISTPCCNAVRGETVTHIFVTHTHIDHVPATPAMAKATGAKVYSYGPHPTAGRRARPSRTGDFSFAPDIKLNDGDVVAGRRLERRGGLYARPHLQPSLLRGEGGQRAAVGRSRHGLVDGGDLAARRQHGRLFRLPAQAPAAPETALHPDARRGDPQSASLRRGLYRASPGPRGADHGATQGRPADHSADGRQELRRHAACTCTPPPAARCWRT